MILSGGNEESAISPLMTWLSIFGGALLAGAFALFGAWLQSVREHSKWTRDQRLRAYADHLAATDNFMRAAVRGDVSEVSTVSTDSIRAIAAVHLLGPDDVYESAVEFQDAMKASADLKGLVEALEDKRLAKRNAFIEAARAQIKV
ncbi:hypothetical protein [Zhihengliuella sp. ISTPL4]|uniref:hypothetical protein n=1 Tax=Zhihengliuella sp. ISTPL4 TaxID=2058657 RepID=UPI000C7A418D|nr:hypothetical protein [Zhihengliuella sp. ISTPL4]